MNKIANNTDTGYSIARSNYKKRTAFFLYLDGELQGIFPNYKAAINSI